MNKLTIVLITVSMLTNIYGLISNISNKEWLGVVIFAIALFTNIWFAIEEYRAAHDTE